MILYKFLLSFLVALQIVGPSWMVAFSSSEVLAQDISDVKTIIAGLRGVVTVTPATNNRPGYAPKYRSLLESGDVIATEEESVAELLLGNQGIVTLQEYSEAVLEQQTHDDLAVMLNVGAAEWSQPLKGTSSIPLALSTPNVRARTRGGLVTVQVQPTLGNTAIQNSPQQPFVVRTSLLAQSSTGGNVALLETFCVKEGSLQLEYPGVQSGVLEQKEVPAGQCAGFLNGTLQAMGDQHQIDDWRAVCSVVEHCEIPESAKKQIAEKQMKQALALEEALLGSEADEGEVDENIILATTGLSLAGNIIVEPPPEPVIPVIILPCSGTEECSGTPNENVPGAPNTNVPPPVESPGSGNVPPPVVNPGSGFDGMSPGPNVGGGVPPLGGPGGSGSGGNPSPSTNVQTLTTLVPPLGVSGGIGSLLFLDSDFAADKELVMVDSGIKADAPHQGNPPITSLVVSALTPTGGTVPSNQRLPFQFSSFNQSGSPTVQLGVEGLSRESQARKIAQFARSASISPNTNLDDSVPEGGAVELCSSLLDCFEVILAVGDQGTFENPESDAGIDGSIQARSSSTIDPLLGLPETTRDVGLDAGVVLANTTVSLARQQSTSNGTTGTGAIVGTKVESSALSFLGNPGDPAVVSLDDRALALLDGSRIQPSANQSVSTSLLTIVDSQLTGPKNSPVIGKDSNGNDVIRQDIPPVIEIIGSSATTETGVVVASTASGGQTGVLDQTLLEASSPLVAMIQGTMETASDFGQIGGKNAKVVANLVTGDALIRLDASAFTANGNLFAVADGAQLLVTNGALLSLRGNSTANINGAFVSVTGAGSLFSLAGGSLVDFGSGTNMVNVSNNLCSSGGCFAPFSDPSLMVAGDQANFSAPTGYNPFVDAGTFADGSVNSVNVTPGSAILEVQQGGRIQIQ